MPKGPDIIGKVFGKLTVLKFSHYSKSKITKGKQYFECLCTCGTRVFRTKYVLGKAKVPSCGCDRYKDRTGMFYGRLTVVSRQGRSNTGEWMWLCKCDCGNHVTAMGSNLGRSVVSCGKHTTYPTNRIDDRKLAIFRTLYSHLRARCTYRGVTTVDYFPLETFITLSKANCTYCGISPNTVQKDRHTVKQGYITEIKVNGIDRVDPLKGYTLENSVTCCWQCNRSKNISSVEEFKAWVKKTYEHMFGITHDN